MVLHTFLDHRRRSEHDPLTSQWAFMLVLNLSISVSVPGIALWDHIGGLVAGLAIGALLLALQRSRA